MMSIPSRTREFHNPLHWCLLLFSSMTKAAHGWSILGSNASQDCDHFLFTFFHSLLSNSWWTTAGGQKNGGLFDAIDPFEGIRPDPDPCQ
jgi:hypothetical protein